MSTQVKWVLIAISLFNLYILECNVISSGPLRNTYCNSAVAQYKGLHKVQTHDKSKHTRQCTQARQDNRMVFDKRK